METNRVPVTYKNNKAEKQLPEYEKLWKATFWGFDTRIGTITNASTTMYEIQSLFDRDSMEYEELERRLKVFRFLQGVEIDRAKNGSKPRSLPKKWITFQKILPEDDADTVKRKEFENKLVIDKRPEFMKFLYSSYAREYKAFIGDFDKYSMIKFGKSIAEVREIKDKTHEMDEMLEYFDKKNPLLETDGVMNRVSRYMQKELKDIKKIPKKCDNQAIFDKIFNKNIEIDQEKLELMRGKYREYHDFKATKQLQVSEFSTYEQFYKYLRNKSLEEISSNIQELANLAVYLCYQENSNKPKDFCWDVFGGGIVDNLLEKKDKIKVPQMSDDGDIDYLGDKYKMVEICLTSEQCGDVDSTNDSFFDVEDIFGDIDTIEDY